MKSKTNLEKLTDLIFLEMIQGIDEVLIGKRKTFKSKYICPEMIKTYMLGCGWKDGDDFETNGWQYDWWMNFTKGDLKYTAFGSGYYGKFEFFKTEV